MSRRFAPFPLLARWAVRCGVVLALASPAAADSLLLSDGSRLEGQITRADDGWFVTLASGKKVHVAREQVVGFNVGSKNDAMSADRRLASLRSAAENMPDLHQVVDRFRDFVQQNAGTPAGEKAKTDLQIWEDRLDRKLVKVGDKWVSDVERAELATKSFQTAEQAMDLLRQGRTQQAAPIVEQALAENAQNPAAWYLRGLLLWKQDKTPEAKKAFDQVVALAADSAAGHNNLAIVLWRQKQYVAALLSYDRALLAAPQNRFVLDNLAEALNALPADLRSGTNVKKVVRHFNDQDLIVQQAMATQGWYRWGSTWVRRDDLEKLKAAEKEIRDKIDQMEADYNALTARIRRMDGDIAAVESTLRRMESDSVGVDAAGHLIRYPLPPSYYTYLRDLGAMKADREQLTSDQAKMRLKARALVQGLPTPRYSGVQRMIEVEGTPVIGKPAAAPAPVAQAPAAPAPAAPVPGAPVAPAPPVPAAPAAPAPAAPVNPPAPVAPVEPPSAPVIPPVVMPPALPELPTRRPAVPPEKPSILDRRLSEPPAGDPEQPLLEPRQTGS